MLRSRSHGSRRTCPRAHPAHHRFPPRRPLLLHLARSNMFRHQKNVFRMLSPGPCGGVPLPLSPRWLQTTPKPVLSLKCPTARLQPPPHLFRPAPVYLRSAHHGCFHTVFYQQSLLTPRRESSAKSKGSKRINVPSPLLATMTLNPVTRQAVLNLYPPPPQLPSNHQPSKKSLSHAFQVR